MATIKEQVNKIMYYAHTTEEKILALESSDFCRALKAVDRIEESFTTLETLGLMEDACGCGGCEDALAKCLEVDASGMTPEEFIKTCFEILGGRFDDEV